MCISVCCGVAVDGRQLERNAVALLADLMVPDPPRAVRSPAGVTRDDCSRAAQNPGADILIRTVGC